MYPYLPKDDPEPERRAQQLASFRKKYRFNYEYIPTYPFLDKVPERENFSLHYWLTRLWSLAALPFNLLLAGLRTALFHPIKKLADYENLFIFYKKPNALESWLSDESFADQRLTGCNPQAIQRLDEIPDDLPFTDEHLQALIGPGRTRTEECARKRLYMVDYRALSHIKGGEWKGRKKTTPGPRALFWWDEEASRLRCVGIQVRREAGARVFLPSDPHLDWLAAKIAYQCADANHQELGTHFAWTHMVMAPVAVVTNRRLGLAHPVHLLLDPHFRFYLFDNELGRVAFINPGGAVDRMMGGTLEESLGIPLNLYKDWNILEAALPRDLARRKVDDPRSLPDYPFRDDGLLVWNAIADFVANYIRIYYQTDGDVTGDEELQAWAHELASYDGGRVAGMPETIKSIEQLIEILTIVVWICGPLHSMLNFSQWDYINVPNMPYAIYDDIPEKVGSVDIDTLMRIMPPYRQAAFQLYWCKILTSYRYDQLGDYRSQFDDPRAQMAVDVFRQRLAAIEQEIESRDARRRVSFPYFKPSKCINSINT